MSESCSKAELVKLNFLRGLIVNLQQFLNLAQQGRSIASELGLKLKYENFLIMSYDYGGRLLCI